MKFAVPSNCICSYIFLHLLDLSSIASLSLVEPLSFDQINNCIFWYNSSERKGLRIEQHRFVMWHFVAAWLRNITGPASILIFLRSKHFSQGCGPASILIFLRSKHFSQGCLTNLMMIMGMFMMIGTIIYDGRCTWEGYAKMIRTRRGKTRTLFLRRTTTGTGSIATRKRNYELASEYSRFVSTSHLEYPQNQYHVE